MRYMNTARSLLLSILLLTSAAAAARAADDTDDRYDYDETARVARISLIAGDVSLQRAGTHKWERAALNFPLVEGDRLATGANSHVEIQIDARNFVRVGAYATLDVVTLRAEGVALSLPEGTATLRLARFDHEHEYFEIDAPKTTIAAELKGLYRLDVEKDGRVRVAARDGGRARVYSDTSGFVLREGRAAELSYTAAGEGDWNFTTASDLDNWDRWNDDRERYLASRLRYDNRERYYDAEVFGAEELDAYGDWVNTNDYGYVWRPRTVVVNNYYNWAPYRYGHWTWCPPYGWTWVGDEPWGWAPYHYGRWVYYNNYWCWAPRGYYHYNHRSWWRPALVAFVILNHNSHVAWYPLGYHQPDPHARYYRQPQRLSPLPGGQVGNLHRINPIYQRAVTTLPARDFGSDIARAQPANSDLARNALNVDPVRKLTVRPVGIDADGGTGPGRMSREERTLVGLPARVKPGDPGRELSVRPTGAAARVAGKPLDADLRRERIFNNRAPRPVTPDRDSSTSERENERPTGAVARPTRPARNTDGNVPLGIPDVTERPERTRTVERPSGQPDGDTGTRPDFRRERREREGTPGDDRPTPNVRERPPAEAHPVPVEERRIEPPAERPVPKTEREPKGERPPQPRYERPEKYERPEPRAERPAPPPREERPAPREERPQPREERPPAPPREERSSPPERSAPPREERQPPPREERRAEPKSERQPPPKVERERPPTTR